MQSVAVEMDEGLVGGNLHLLPESTSIGIHTHKFSNHQQRRTGQRRAGQRRAGRQSCQPFQECRALQG